MLLPPRILSRLTYSAPCEAVRAKPIGRTPESYACPSQILAQQRPWHSIRDEGYGEKALDICRWLTLIPYWAETSAWVRGERWIDGISSETTTAGSIPTGLSADTLTRPRLTHFRMMATHILETTLPFSTTPTATKCQHREIRRRPCLGVPRYGVGDSNPALITRSEDSILPSSQSLRRREPRPTATDTIGAENGISASAAVDRGQLGS